MATREYVGDGIVVYWDSDRCFHSERCVAGLPTVFDRGARPWVQPTAATAAAVAAVIDTCPSGALSYSRTDGAPPGRRGRAVDEDPAAAIAVDPEWEASTPPARTEEAVVAPSPAVTISPLTNGPLSVVGPVAVRRPDGTTEITRRTHLCRCGHSGNKPFCDGSHARVGFVADGAPPAEG